MNPVRTSLFDLFKIGPGPSSSHTIGPMLAGLDFIRHIHSLPSETLAGAEAIKVHLYGSLSATGKGHGTDRAVLAGLSGEDPENCSPDVLSGLLQDPAAGHPVSLGPKTVFMTESDIIFDRVEHGYPHSNTLIIRLLGRETCIFEREYYSIGGGFITWKGQPEPKAAPPVYPYENMNQLEEQLKGSHLRLEELLLANEQAVGGMSEDEIHGRLDRIMEVMETAVHRGLAMDGALPGPIGLRTRAGALYKKASEQLHQADRTLVHLDAYALAVSEQNAFGAIVVTAPTLGSCGIIPSVLYLLKHHHRIDRGTLRKALLAAAAIGFLIKQNASISGAEVGCQGEIGTASAMAAALLCRAHDFPVEVISDAAAIALEHHLGLTCDPVQGYVQIPCIERNAMGAVKSYNAFLLAGAGDSTRKKVGFDQVVGAMAETGRDMSKKYKETSQGGLAMCCINC